MREFGVVALHPAGEHVWNCAFLVKSEAKLPVNAPEDSVVFLTPNRTKILELFEPHVAHPPPKFTRLREFMVGVCNGFAVVQNILILSVAEVAQYVLGVAWELFKV